MENISSEQELLELRKDGKITEEEFNQLLAALRKSRPNNIQQETKSTPKKTLRIILAIVVLGVILSFAVIHFSKPRPITLEEFRRDFPQKVAKLNIDTANLKDVIKIFGEPIKYIWGEHIIDRTDIPTDHYCVVYPDGVHLLMRWDSIVELRFESPEADYVFDDKIRVGSSLEEVIEEVGEPTEIVEGGEIGWADGVLYKDVEGRKGYCYYHRSDQNVRFFFLDYKVKAIYVTRSDYNNG